MRLARKFAEIQELLFGHVFLGYDKCYTTGLAILIFAILSIYWGTAVGSRSSDFLRFCRQLRAQSMFSRKKPRGRNTSLSLAYERVNERAEWFGRQPVQPNLRLSKRVRIMNISLKSFASFVVVVGISGLGAANSALAGGHGSHGSSGHSSNGPSRNMSSSQGTKSSHQFDKHDSYKYDHCWDKGSYCHSYYGCYPWNSCYSSYCYPCYRPCYAPNCCCEYAPPCQEYCSPVCYEEPCYQTCPQPCFPSCPEYCGEYCYGSRYYPWDRCYDRYKDRDYRRDRDEFKGRQDFSKMSHESHNSKSPVTVSPKGNSGIGQMGKLASHTSGMSGGSHGSRR